MGKPKYTHAGFIVSAADESKLLRLVRLRETKTLWVDADGNRWRKTDGIPMTAEPEGKLDLADIQPISHWE